MAKGNQSTLRDELHLFFSEPLPTAGTGAPRVFLADKWVGVAQVFRLVRTVTKKGQTSEEVVYGLTALYGFPSS